jgi:hypothetical protein
MLGGGYVYGSYPDIDALFDQQTAETDQAKRERHYAADFRSEKFHPFFHRPKFRCEFPYLCAGRRDCRLC